MIIALNLKIKLHNVPNLSLRGLGYLPPPTNDTVEIVWCGDLKGLLLINGFFSDKFPAILCILVISKHSSKLKSGNIFEVADIVRNLTFKQKDKGLSTTEKKMLLNAKQILVSELVLAEDKEKDFIENLVDNKINESYESHNIGNIIENAEDLQKQNVVKKFIQA